MVNRIPQETVEMPSLYTPEPGNTTSITDPAAQLSSFYGPTGYYVRDGRSECRQVHPNTNMYSMTPRYEGQDPSAHNKAYGYTFNNALPHDSVSSRPRGYSTIYTQSPTNGFGPVSEAYPPTSYLMDPQKHQSYMSISSPSLYENELLKEKERLMYDRQPMMVAAEHGFPYPHSPIDSTASTAPIANVDDPYSELHHQPQYTLENLENFAMIEEDLDGEENGGDEPYAKLIYKALLSAPGNRMVLKEIYDWFEKHTEKPRNGSNKGWQNSIRHNLSMNGAFTKVEQIQPGEDKQKGGYVWVLEPSAKTGGVKSTTRYRKICPSKKSCKADSYVPARQLPGRKGGKAARKGKNKRERDLEKATVPNKIGCALATVDSFESNHWTDPSNLECHPLSDQHATLAYLEPNSLLLPQRAGENSQQYDLSHVVGVTDSFHEDQFLQDASSTTNGILSPVFSSPTSSANTPYFTTYDAI